MRIEQVVLSMQSLENRVQISHGSYTMLRAHTMCIQDCALATNVYDLMVAIIEEAWQTIY